MNRHGTWTGAWALLACGLSGAAAAQTAEVLVYPWPAVAVAPGQPVEVSVVVRWTGAPQFAHIAGSVVVTGDAGTASNFSSDFGASPPVVNLGSFVGGSRRGIDVTIWPAIFTGGVPTPPSMNSSGITVAKYDLEFSGASFPGFYYIHWVPDPAFPEVSLYTSLSSPQMAHVVPATFGTWVYAGGCCFNPCRPDLTAGAVAGTPGYGQANGVLNNDDFFYYLAQFAAGNVAKCDMTHGAVPGSHGYAVPNFVLNNDDFFFYLDLFAQGC